MSVTLTITTTLTAVTVPLFLKLILLIVLKNYKLIDILEIANLLRTLFIIGIMFKFD